MTAVHIWAIPQKVTEDGDRSESMGWWQTTETREVGEDCEKLERDSVLCMRGLCVSCWMRMLETVESGSKSLRSYWLRLNGMIVAVLQVQACADSSIAHHCLCVLY